MYQRILTDPLNFPLDMPSEARSVMTGLLQRDPARRLGANGGEEIKRHPFFAKYIDWNRYTLRGLSVHAVFLMLFPDFSPKRTNHRSSLALYVFLWLLPCIEYDIHHRFPFRNRCWTSPTLTLTLLMKRHKTRLSQIQHSPRQYKTSSGDSPTTPQTSTSVRVSAIQAPCE